MTNDKSNARHFERSRGIPERHLRTIPRDPSTLLPPSPRLRRPGRSAQDDNVMLGLRHSFVIRISDFVIF
jgi:hypothetical protein